MDREERQESGQLPEEAPSDHVFEDEGSGRSVRPEAENTPGIPGETGRATGESAGQESQPGPLTGYDELVSRIGKRAGLGYGQAQRALQATLATLAQRISPGEAGSLAVELPPEAARSLRRHTEKLQASGPEAFSAGEFVRRVAEREGQPAAKAEEHARAVFQTLREAVAQGQFDEAIGSLADDFKILIVSRRP